MLWDSCVGLWSDPVVQPYHHSLDQCRRAPSDSTGMLVFREQYHLGTGTVYSQTVSGSNNFRSRLHFFKASAFCGEQNFKKPILSLFVSLGVMSQ
jgi:hypothetical protein